MSSQTSPCMCFLRQCSFLFSPIGVLHIDVSVWNRENSVPCVLPGGSMVWMRVEVQLYWPIKMIPAPRLVNPSDLGVKGFYWEPEGNPSKRADGRTVCRRLLCLCPFSASQDHVGSFLWFLLPVEITKRGVKQIDILKILRIKLSTFKDTRWEVEHFIGSHINNIIWY